MNDEGGHVSEARGNTSVPEKRCQPFTMIPLERWNAGTQRQIPR
jgi:hypothetical protein